MILTVLGHPSPGSFNEALAEAYTRGVQETGRESTLIRLADLNYDPVLHTTQEGQELEPDLQFFREQILRAQHINWVFPVWWGSSPALLKGVIDRTFLPGWAFRLKSNGMPEGLLAGRSARTLVTMDAPSWFYRLMYGRSAHNAFKNATLWYVGFKPILSSTYYAVRTSSPKQREKWLKQAEQLGRKDSNVSQQSNPSAKKIYFYIYWHAFKHR
ncbi:MAG: NAD(P)H-dependent oxidoreductase [Myxococcales bacterium]|nr:NAD(P)H-dependent oxidoreductase [Myxococcales bacterium]